MINIFRYLDYISSDIDIKGTAVNQTMQGITLTVPLD